MIYAINKHTKEHRVVKSNGLICEKEWYTAHGWLLTHANSEGWIEWNGGECPLPDDVQCEYRMRDGEIDTAKGSSLWWHVEQEDTDIIAYRPILSEPSKPEAPEWDGSGMPPVGCECEARNYHYGQAFEAAKVVHRTRKGVILVEYASGDAGFLTAPADFRPIRSEEDVAVEEMLALDCEPHEGMLSRADFCRTLYRAGYRKRQPT